jgi:hypothetical protein
MIKKPVVVQTKHSPLVMSQINAPIVRPSKPKPVTSYQTVVSVLQDFQKSFTEDVPDCLVADLAKLIDPAVLIKYLVKQTLNSKFSAYRMALRNFHSAMDRYFEGAYKNSDLETYRDNLVDDHSDITFHEFYKFRIYLIDAIVNKEIRGLVECLYILCYSPNAMYDAESFKLYEKSFKAQIINLTEIVWPEESKALRVMFGAANG